MQHGFVRTRDGDLTSFDVPGAGTGRFQGTGGPDCFDYIAAISADSGISPSGPITGAYFQPIQGNPFGGNWRGFLRARDGSFATFDAATYPPCCIWTFAIAINPAEVIVGFQNDGHSVNHGFLRARDGTVTALDAPGAGTHPLQGTVADGINPAGSITGWYIDANNIRHGFLWTP
jgi:hypothetical protein